MNLRMARILVFLTIIPFTIAFADLDLRTTITCSQGSIVCGSRCIPASSNCCSDGGWCNDGGTCYEPPSGGISCCIPGHSCAAAGGKTVNAPPIPTCGGSTPNVCGSHCIGAGDNCCQGGGWCSGGGTCYTKQDGTGACCIPGKDCLASGGVTLAAMPTGPATPSTVTSTRAVTSTATTAIISTTASVITSVNTVSVISTVSLSPDSSSSTTSTSSNVAAATSSEAAATSSEGAATGSAAATTSGSAQTATDTDVGPATVTVSSAPSSISLGAAARAVEGSSLFGSGICMPIALTLVTVVRALLL